MVVIMPSISTPSDDRAHEAQKSAQTLTVPLVELHPGPEHLHRDVDPAQVERMLASWDPRVLTPLLVSARPDGGYEVVDGHHRLEALRQRGDALVPVTVIQPLSVPERAELVYRIDAARPRPLHAQDRYRILLAGEEPVAVAIEETLTSFELTGLHTGVPDEVRAVATLRDAFGQDARTPYAPVPESDIQDGRRVLEWVIRTALAMRGNSVPASHVLGKEIAAALIWIRRNARAVPSTEKLREVLSVVDPAQLREYLISAGHGRGSASTSQAGLELAAWINRASYRELIKLDDALWTLWARQN